MRNTSLVCALLVFFALVAIGCSSGGSDLATSARAGGGDDDDDTTVPDDDDNDNDDNQDDDSTTPPDDDDNDDDDNSPDDDDNDDNDDDTTPPNDITVNSPTENENITDKDVYVDVFYQGDPVNPAIMIDNVSVIDELVFDGGDFYGFAANLAPGSHQLIAEARYNGYLERRTVDFTLAVPTQGWIELQVTPHYLALGDPPAVASYTVYNSQGQDVTSGTVVDLSSYPANGVQISGTQLTFSAAGAYRIDATATVDGNQVTGHAYVVVVQEWAVDHVTVSCTPNKIAAGQTTSCLGVAYDAGNKPMPQVPIIYSTEPANAASMIEGGEITITMAGSIKVDATAAGTPKYGTTTVQVTAGSPSKISLVLDPPTVPVDQTSTAKVWVTDQYGNQLNQTQNATLTASPSQGIDISGMSLTPHVVQPFQITATATVNGSQVQDQQTLNVANPYPPMIDVTSPTRGAFITGSSQINVVGRVYSEFGAVVVFKINGQDVSFDGQGNFSSPLTLIYGLNTIVFHAEDDSGNATDATLSVMWAQNFLPNGENVPRALGAFVSAQGFGNISNIAQQILNSAIAVILNNMSWPMTLFSQDYHDPVFGIDLGTVTATMDKPSLTLSQLLVTPTDNNNLAVHIDVTNLAVGGSVGLSWLGSAGFTLTVPDLTLDTTLAVSVDGSGNLTVTMGDVTLNDWESNATLHLDNSIADFLFGWLLNLVLNNFLTGVINPYIVQEIQTVLPPYIQQALQGLSSSMSFGFSFLGHTYNITADFNEFSTDAIGSTLWLDANITYDSNNWVVGPNTPDLPGSVLTADGEPTFTGYVPSTGQPYDLGVVIGDEVFNRLFYVIHRSGVISLDLDHDTLQNLFGINLDLTTGAMGLLFPGLWAKYGMSVPVVIELRPLLPPLLNMNSGKDKDISAQVQIGEFDIYFQTNGEEWAKLAMSITVPATIGVAKGQKVHLTFGTINMVSDLFEAADGIHASQDLFDTWLPGLVKVLLPMLLNAVNNFPIPSIQGFTLTVDALEKDGPGADWIGLYGDLTHSGDKAEDKFLKDHGLPLDLFVRDGKMVEPYKR